MLLAACGGGDGSDANAPTPSSSVTTESAPGASQVTVTPSAADPAGLPNRINLERVFPNLTFARMTGLHQSPDGRWYVLEQRGRVLVFDNWPDAQAQVFLDLTNRVNATGSEEGLLGLAFAPDFSTSRAFYLYYSAIGQRRTVLSRFVADPSGSGGAETVLLEIPQPFANHNGGQIAFGPDGYLYVGLGDGGSARDPMSNGQNLGVLLGKILRIDVASASANLPYAIPADNPFLGRAGARGEIWAYGVRNPWRFSFDPQTGDLWVGDVGQNEREEVNLVTKGGNYGWAIMEGTGCLGQPPCDQEGLMVPIKEYETGQNCSITGGFVYRGTAIPVLRGAYVYSDYCSGRIWALRYNGSTVTADGELFDANIQISSFARDNDGELYVLAHGDAGGIFKLVP